MIDGAPAIEGEIVVRFAAGATASDRQEARGLIDATRVRNLGLPGLELLRLRGDDVENAVADLQRRSEVDYAEPNFVYEQTDIPNDPSFGQLWGLNNTGQTVNGVAGTPDADIDAPEAWDTTTGDPSVVVAVVDSGITHDHPDLAPNMWFNPGETPGNGTDDDGNGFIDDTQGWDFVAGDNDPFDLNLHGTHVAGTIGAKGNNNTGVAGVNWDVSLMALRVLNNAGSGTNAGITAAFNYAGDNGADVVNASLGGGGFSQAMFDSMNNAPNTLFVVAAGNDATNNDTTPVFPCNYTAANNICVAATDSNDALASFSNVGATSVDLAAPGTSIFSSLPNFESQFNETFSDGVGWTTRWNTGGTNNSWGLQGAALADSPNANYLNNTDSFARKTAGVNLTGQRGCKVDYALNLATEFQADFFDITSSINGTNFNLEGSWTGSTSGTFFNLSTPLGTLDNQAQAHFGFGLFSNAAITGAGAVLDDIDLQCIEPGYDDDEYGFLQGTSMATPHVAGAAALLLAAEPSATVADLRAALLDGVDPKPGLSGQVVTGGRLNLKSSIDLIATGDNEPPVAEDDTLITDVDTPGTVNVLDNDFDPDGDGLTLTNSTDAENGEVDCTEDGDCTYTPDAGFSGVDLFEYTLSDGNGGTDTATVNVTVEDVCTPVVRTLTNGDPNTQDGALSVLVDGLGAFGSATGGGDADFNPPGPAGPAGTVFSSNLYVDALGRLLGDDCAGEVEVVSESATSLVTRVTLDDLQFDITQQLGPIAGGTSSELTQTYAIKNLAASTQPLVLVRHVDGDLQFDGTISDGGAASADGSVLYEFDASDNPASPSTFVGISGALGADEVPDRWTIKPYDYRPIIVGAAGIPATDNGIVHNDTNSDRIVDTPFDVTLSQQWNASVAAGATQSFTTTTSFGQQAPNQNPNAVDDNLTTLENTAGDVNVLTNDTDPDGDSLTVTGKTNGDHGDVECTTAGVCTYTPDAGFSGADSFTYTVSDGRGGTDTATVNVTVTPVNADPNAVDDSLTTPEDTPGNVNVLTNDTDPDGDSLTVTGKTNGDHGDVDCTTAGVCTYTPDANYNGPDDFTYTIGDGNGGSDTATVNVTVTPVNDNPDAVDNSLTTPEDTPGNVNVLTNDTDVDGDTLTVTGKTNGDHGDVDCTPAGICTYTPDANFNGSDDFTYTISDGNGGSDTATVNVTVTPVNDDPTAVDDSLTTPQDTAGNVDVLDNDTDVDGDSLTITGFTSGAHGTVECELAGVCVYSPNTGFSGADSFTYIVIDGQGGNDTATVNVTVTPSGPNQNPSAVNDTLTTPEDTAANVNVLTNDTDPNGDGLTVTGKTNGDHGDVECTPAGVCTYTPDANYNGPDDFTYTVGDGNGGSDTATVDVTVTPVNDPPVANDNSLTTPEDTSGNVNVLTNDTDVDGDTLTVTSKTDGDHGDVDCTPAGVCTYTPDANYNGPDDFTYTVGDGNGGSDTATVNVTVTPVNDDPNAVDDSLTTPEDTSANTNVLTNDTDPDGHSLTVTSKTNGDHGDVDCTPAGVCTYTPDATYNGPDDFTYTVSDGNGGSDTATVNVTVTPVNDPPLAVGDSLTTPEDTAGNVNVLTNDTDPDGHSLTVTGKTNGDHGDVDCTPAGICTYTPDANYNGPDDFTYTVGDGNGGSDTATVNVTVTPVNDPPLAVGDSLTTPEDTPGNVNVLTNDTEVDGDSLTVTSETDGAHGTVGCTPAGICTYTPEAGFSGTDSFTYTIGDGNGGSDTASVAVTVTPEGDDNPPNTKIKEGPKGNLKKKKAKKVTFRFISTEAGSTFECKMDSGAWNSCTSPKVYRNVKLGKHTFKVRATDSAGNTDPTPATRNFKVVKNSRQRRN